MTSIQKESVGSFFQKRQTLNVITTEEMLRVTRNLETILSNYLPIKKEIKNKQSANDNENKIFFSCFSL